jgi:hypothetical protein
VIGITGIAARSGLAAWQEASGRVCHEQNFVSPQMNDLSWVDSGRDFDVPQGDRNGGDPRPIPVFALVTVHPVNSLASVQLSRSTANAAQH